MCVHIYSYIYMYNIPKPLHTWQSKYHQLLWNHLRDPRAHIYIRIYTCITSQSPYTHDNLIITMSLSPTVLNSRAGPSCTPTPTQTHAPTHTHQTHRHTHRRTHSHTRTHAPTLTHAHTYTRRHRHSHWNKIRHKHRHRQLDLRRHTYSFSLGVVLQA